MQQVAQPWYLQFLYWAANILQIVYPIALLIILGLALTYFKRLVDHMAPKETVKKTTVKKTKTEAEEKEPKF